jgi:hypothetical protein
MQFFRKAIATDARRSSFNNINGDQYNITVGDNLGATTRLWRFLFSSYNT